MNKQLKHTNYNAHVILIAENIEINEINQS